MSGGLSFLNHCLAIPVFVIPPNGILNLLPDQTSDEWRSLFGFSVGFGDGGGRYKKKLPTSFGFVHAVFKYNSYTACVTM